MYAKFANFARLYIFYSLQHFTTKPRNFSKRGMLFQAMVIFLPLSIFFKILSERGKVHWGGGGGVYSYIHVLPAKFLFKLINLNLI